MKNSKNENIVAMVDQLIQNKFDQIKLGFHIQAVKNGNPEAIIGNIYNDIYQEIINHLKKKLIQIDEKLIYERFENLVQFLLNHHKGE